LVDSYLLARKFIPRWQNADTSDGVFWKYVTSLLPQVAPEYEGSRQTFAQFKCEQVLIGKTKVEKGKDAGRVIAKQQRCVYASGQTKPEGRIPKTRLLPTVGPQEELGELPTPVSAIVTLSAARWGWGGVGNII
jgi:hypothetical protein